MKNVLTALRTEPFTTEREWTVEGIPVLSASVSVPQPVPAADRISRRILKYYQLQCRSYLRYCEKWLLPQAETEYRAALAASAPLPCFRAELGYRVTYNEGGLWSLYTQSREVTLPGQTILTRRGDTWDLSAGFPIPLGDFYPARSPWKRQLMALTAEEIQRQERAGVAQYHLRRPQDLRRRFNPQNYYLTREGLTVFFPMYAIAPAVESIPTFTIPYAQLGEGAFTRLRPPEEP